MNERDLSVLNLVVMSDRDALRETLCGWGYRVVELRGEEVVDKASLFARAASALPSLANVCSGPRSAEAGGVGPAAYPNVGPEATAEGGGARAIRSRRLAIPSCLVPKRMTTSLEEGAPTNWSSFGDGLTSMVFELEHPKVALMWTSAHRMLESGLADLLVATDVLVGNSRLTYAQDITFLTFLLGDGPNFPRMQGAG